jgi:hypothetical protein
MTIKVPLYHYEHILDSKYLREKYENYKKLYYSSQLSNLYYHNQVVIDIEDLNYMNDLDFD